MRKDKAVRKAELKAAFIQKLKSLIGPLIILAIILAAVAVILLWPETIVEEEKIAIRGYDGEKQEFIMENDKLLFSMDSETTQFSVTVKETGEVWYSNPQDAQNDALAFVSEKNKLQSTVLLTYSNINGVDALYNNYEHSITNKLYEIEQGADYVKVDYTIGSVQREYIIPLVMRLESYENLTSAMSGSNKSLLSQYYKKLDINNLSKADEKEKDTLLERYPIMETEVIYILRDTAKEAVKKKMETVFADAGYTYDNYLEDKALDTAEKTSDKPIFNLSVIYRLEGDQFIIEVPADSIEYKEKNPVYSISLLPYFGAAAVSEEGFLFVPEGGGALINFNNGRLNQNSYYADVYGWDMAKNRTALVHETKTNFNVFGESRGNASFICVIENGAPYASIQADISGRYNSYNFVNSVFNVVKREKYAVSNKINNEVYVYEPQLPEGEVYSQRYCFVNSGDYVDMAKTYQDYLFEKYPFNKKDTAETPVVVEVVGAVDKIKQVFGVPVSKPLALTTFDEAADILTELQNSGMNELSVKLTGWANDGVRQKMLSKIKAVKELGGNKALTNLVKTADSLGVQLYLDGITNYAIDSDFGEGFFVFTDAARQVSKEKAELYEYSTTSYGQRDDLAKYYLLKNSLIYEMADNLVEKADSYGVGVSFADIGKELSADFNRKAPVSRQAVLEQHTEYLAGLLDKTNVMVNEGNDYAIAYADMVTNMDLRGSEYTIIDRKVPFYQMALHGYIEYVGEALNLTANPEDELLKSAEYGAGLSFTFMQENPFTLQNTLYMEYFGAEYDAYKDIMYETYNRYNSELGHVFNQEMTDHEFLTEDVTCTTYADGTKVYVNYSYYDYTTTDGAVVSARDYTVTR